MSRPLLLKPLLLRIEQMTSPRDRDEFVVELLGCKYFRKEVFWNGNMMELKSCWIFCFLPVISGYCSSQTYYAQTDNSYIYHTYYSSNEDCTFTIKPRTDSRTARSHDDRGSSGDYFLEISWSDFDVRGKMPSCNNDYVEIFLTR